VRPYPSPGPLGRGPPGRSGRRTGRRHRSPAPQTNGPATGGPSPFARGAYGAAPKSLVKNRGAPDHGAAPAAAVGAGSARAAVTDPEEVAMRT